MPSVWFNYFIIPHCEFKSQTMKSFLITLFLFVQVYHGVTSHSVSIFDNDAFDSKADPRVCRLGLVAFLPETFKPAACTDPHEIYACGYSEGRCDNRGFCGTPPCHWRCWCLAPYRRNTDGKCTLLCAQKAEQASISFPF